jgi:ribosome-associated protein
VSPDGSVPERESQPDVESTQPAESPRSQELLDEIARYAADKKAGEVVELDLRDVLGYTDWFLICTGNTERQTKAIHDGILEGCKREHLTLPRRVEGFSRGDWILMDYLDVIVHIFTPATREYYRLEQLWGEAPARAAGGEA